ncbi:MAG TPA: DivIVA domain-containing protein [Yinghuangia sp.]|uniref:DivIVA domain-containing protein n=1 Tax=Yinghuangia sp. YIM S10712 TaxID=3436930 RepID=UPI002CBD9AD5|nr:DivIVA domain-containing protein [Yinghuangia sp.]
MFWIQLVVVTGVVFVVAAVVLGAGGSLPDAHQDRPDLSPAPDRPLTVEDIDRVRFPVVLRGYRMSEVDYMLDRLSAELSARDARIMDLEYRLAGVLPPGVAAPANLPQPNGPAAAVPQPGPTLTKAPSQPAETDQAAAPAAVTPDAAGRESDDTGEDRA